MSLPFSKDYPASTRSHIFHRKKTLQLILFHRQRRRKKLYNVLPRRRFRFRCLRPRRRRRCPRISKLIWSTSVRWKGGGSIRSPQIVPSPSNCEKNKLCDDEIDSQSSDKTSEHSGIVKWRLLKQWASSFLTFCESRSWELALLLN